MKKNSRRQKMTNKLTLQDCFKYPNAKVIEYDFYNTGQSREYKNIMDYINKHKEYYDFTKLLFNCKLILRDITQLTDEEKEHIAETYLNDSFDNSHIPKTNGKSVASIQNIQEQITLILEICSFEQIVEFIDYLRSINIDIDCFLQSGKAVKG